MRHFFNSLVIFAAVLGFAACHGYVDPETLPDGTDGEVEDSSVVLNSGYAQKMIAMQFTSVGCVNCPFLSSALKNIVAVRPNVIPVAFHMDYDGADPMTLPMNSKFFERVNTGDGMALPLFALNFRKSSQHIINEYSKIESEIALQSGLYPAVCGVALETKYDEATRDLEVKARFSADVKGKYNFHIFLVENGIEYSQAGADEDKYVHDNVLRKIFSDNIKGFKLNAGEPLEPGKEYEEVRTVTLDAGWVAENMRVVVAMLDTKDDGDTFTCNNANACSLGGSADYSYVGALFQKHVCVMEFTGTWCAQCPDGAATLNYLVDRAYAGKAFAMAFHNDGGGEPRDPFALPQEQELHNMFKLGGLYPSYVTDMREGGELNGGGCGNSIEKSLYDTRTYCGVAVSSVYDAETGTAEVEAGLLTERTAEYRFAAYVIEDKVIAPQKESTGKVRDDFPHRHVVRAMISSDVRGDSIGKVQAGTQTGKTFSFKVDEGWNLENLFVAVLAIGEDGQVHNMAQCAVDGGRMDYEYLN